jgi:hypothetical protein
VRRPFDSFGTVHRKSRRLVAITDGHGYPAAVIPRALRPPSLSIALIVVALAACAHELPPPTTVPAPAAATSEELRWAVEAALAARNWSVVERKPGAIGAAVRSQSTGEQATVEITYRPGAVDIRCVTQTVSPGRYDRWMRLLSAEIQKNVAQLGMGTARSPAPSPPPVEP